MELRLDIGTEEVVAVEEFALAKMLEDCLETLAAGGEPDLASIAVERPEALEEILPLLEVAWMLGTLRPPAPDLSLGFVESLERRVDSHYNVA